MYEMSGSLSTATSLLTQLMADASGELLQSLQTGLDEAAKRTAALDVSAVTDPVQREVAVSLPTVFATAQEILDQAALAVRRAGQARVVRAP